MIVTLAGHVDHGKTTLVRLLTGTDTDRLAEEKRRGLTIDLGFAYMKEGPVRVGFVDVPGHHRFIHNMVAGVAAMQHALLVIAADDGPMPQSREHLQILELLGVSRGVIALTKCDAVPAERIAAARSEISQLVAGSFLHDAQIVETAATTGAGIDALRAHLQAAAAVAQEVDSPRSFRMAIDRVFTLKGAGRVVTGTVHAGRLRHNDEPFVFPGATAVRVREMHVQDAPAAGAGPGDRVAVNLTGADGVALTRGHWLCARPEAGHHHVVIDLWVLDDFPRDVRHWTPVHVYHATTHTTARLALLDGSRLSPGGRARAELVMDEPLLGKRGDRVVIRDQGLERTLGGGAVLDNRAYSGRRRAPARLRSIEACAAATPDAALAALLQQGPVDSRAFEALWDLKSNDFDSLLATQGAVGHEGWLMHPDQWHGWRTDLLTECLARHEADPALPGLRENDFRSSVPAEFRTRLLIDLAAAGELEQRAGRFRPRRHRAELSAGERAMLERLHPHLNARQPPSLGDLGRTLRIPLTDLQASAKALAAKGAVVRVSDKRLFLPEHLAELAGIAEDLSASGPFSVRAYRDAAAVGRNVAIDVLEYFDARGFTRRQGETRKVVGERSKLPGCLG